MVKLTLQQFKLMKIPAFQHLIVAVLLSLTVALCLSRLFPRPTFPVFTKGIPLTLVFWFLAFGLTGFSWMIFEGETPLKGIKAWIFRLVRGMFIWGALLGFLIWILPAILKLSTSDGFENVFVFLLVLAIIIGFVLSFVLSIYSYFFIKS
jgi:hypothetical protein